MAKELTLQDVIDSVGAMFVEAAERTEKRFDELSGRMGSMEGRMGRMEKSIDEIKADQQLMREAIERIESYIEGRRDSHD